MKYLRVINRGKGDKHPKLHPHLNAQKITFEAEPI